jgi:F-type H+-transporting ATPase subunit b
VRPASIMKLFPRTTLLLGAGLGASLMLPAVALAAEGMPQLDLANPLTTSQVIWGAVIFVVLYFVLSRSGLPLVASVLDERAARISLDLDGARAAKGRADAGVADAREATAKARAEAQAAIAAAVDEAKKAAAVQAETLNARLEKQLADAESQIAAARASAMGAIRMVATETAATVVTRLTGASPDTGRLTSAVGSALAARGIG